MPTSSAKWLLTERAPPLTLIFITELRGSEEEDEEEEEEEEEEAVSHRSVFSTSFPRGFHLWSDVQTEAVKKGRKSEPVREEKKEGGVSLAGDWESSSAWRQRAKPGALLRPAVVYQS